MPHTIFLLSAIAKGGGNYFTIKRISDYLRNGGYECHLDDPKDCSTRHEFNNVSSREHISIMIGIHALRTGAFMKESCLPYILILGGTDLNVFCDDMASMEIMTEAVYRARFVVCFSKIDQTRALTLWPDLEPERLRIISQAVETCPSSFSLQSYLHHHHPHLWSGHPGRHKPLVFVFVGGIRPVKNPLFLVSTFQDWHARDDRIIFLMVGPRLDEKFTAAIFEPAINTRPGVVYIPGLPSQDVHAVISQSFALVNTSDNEGMCLAILEAMHLGVPILARDCPGNRAIVADGRTGYLFHSPKTFLEKAEQLLNSNELLSEVTRNALEYVHHYHNSEREKLAYTVLLKQCIKELEADV